VSCLDAGDAPSGLQATASTRRNRHSDAATRAAGRHRNEWGDIDNRLKTLFDALRVPGVPQEIASNTRPSSANEPHFTLLEDDALIARINVETDQLLAAPDPSQVRLIIRVNIRASRVILGNPVLLS
jgi:hypothetical protein